MEFALDGGSSGDDGAGKHAMAAVVLQMTPATNEGCSIMLHLVQRYYLLQKQRQTRLKFFIIQLNQPVPGVFERSFRGFLRFWRGLFRGNICRGRHHKRLLL